MEPGWPGFLPRAAMPRADRMNKPTHTTPTWTRLVLIVACIGAVALAAVLVGPPSQASVTTQRVITAEKGVVQSTVSGDGTLQPVTQEDVNFNTSGTLTHLDVSAGDQVTQGQLLATLDRSQAEVALQQANASLASAHASLQQAEDAQANASVSATETTASAADIAYTVRAAAAAETGPTGPAGSGAPSQQTVVTHTTTVTAVPTGGSGGQGASTPSGTSRRNAASGSGSSGSGSSGSGSGSSGAASDPATLAANVASAQATVASAELSVQAAKQTLSDTNLYAPVSGTIASVADVQVGDSVSAGGSSSASSSSSSGTGSSGASGSGSGSGRSGAGTGTGSSSSSSSGAGSSSSSSPLFTIVNLSAMELVVPFTESDIGKVKVGQSATVTVDAISGLELAAHVTNVSLLATTSGSVTSYDVTLKLDQNDTQLKPGMSATAQVVVSQATGAVSVPSTAISRAGGQSTVTVLRNGKQVVTPVTTGVVGDSTTQILSGVTPGQQLVITTRTNLGSSGAASSLGGLGGLGGAGGGGAFRGLAGGGGVGLGGGGGGARTFFGGGG
jgi:multidrug efflux pump subunit AcrA (membrane-fusion protein)